MDAIIGTELIREDMKKLYSNFGLLYELSIWSRGACYLRICEDIDQVRGVMEKYPPYQAIFSKMSYGESQILDKAFYEEEVRRLCLAFEQQFHYAVFFTSLYQFPTSQKKKIVVLKAIREHLSFA